MILKCLILGDSIAKGISGVLKGCTVIAKVGMATGWILSHTPHDSSVHYNTIILSAGTNDDWQHYKYTKQRIDSIEAKNPTSKYILIVPHNPIAAAIIESEPGYHISFIAGQDHMHPKSYYAVRNSIRNLGVLK